MDPLDGPIAALHRGVQTALQSQPGASTATVPANASSRPVAVATNTESAPVTGLEPATPSVVPDQMWVRRFGAAIGGPGSAVARVWAAS